ncbi:MAG: hypothetical protein JW841_12740 [Deltaproteobacteria bacterium]|nr:hypothetical protein [Deltaproteobacteria bacterium]
MQRQLLNLILSLIVLLPNLALAQYKNSSFGLDAGYWLITKPSAVDPSTKTYYNSNDSMPLRLQGGIRVGGESNFKLDDDHFWFTGRINVGFLQFPSGNTAGSLDEVFDAAANKSMGTILGIEGQVGVRYIFLTDRVRPYLQGTLSYMRLMSFSSDASNSCSADATLCGGANNQDIFLAHPNVGGVHLQPGFELIIKRDMAIHIYIDVQRWLIFNASDNNSVVGGIGLLFFT